MTISLKVINSFHLIILSNSPGEVSNWVKPLVRFFRKADPDIYISLFLTPCQYASGREREFSKDITGLNDVFAPEETLRHVFSWPWFTRCYPKGAILFLGGDPLYAQLFSLKYRLPLYGYSEKNASLGLFFKKTFFRSKTGDLMFAGVNDFLLAVKQGAASEVSKNESEDPLLFLTGSRPQHFEKFFPLVCETATLVLKNRPHTKIVIQVSPFISDSLLEKYASLVPAQCQLSVERSLKVMTTARFMVTLPGTNTAEGMYLALPMLVVCPLNYPELLILDGLAGLLDRLPFVGIWIKKAILAYLKKQIVYVSHPNRISHRAVVPELIDSITAEILSKTILTFLNDSKKIDAIRARLKKIGTGVDPREIMVSTILQGEDMR